MAQVTSDARQHLARLRRQSYFRGGDEKTILLGWAVVIEHHIGRLEKGGMSETDIALALDKLDEIEMASRRHLRDIMSSKAPPHCSDTERVAAVARYAAIVADAPWALPNMVKPKGQWGGKR